MFSTIPSTGVPVLRQNVNSLRTSDSATAYTNTHRGEEYYRQLSLRTSDNATAYIHTHRGEEYFRQLSLRTLDNATAYTHTHRGEEYYRQLSAKVLYNLVTSVEQPPQAGGTVI
jgi:YHS domain-containing protein